MASKCVLGISGLKNDLAISLFADGRLLFALEEEKIRRIKGIGLMDVSHSTSMAVDEALRRTGKTIRDIEAVVYVPDGNDNRSNADAMLVSEFFERQYDFSPEFVRVDNLASRVAFARAVSPDVNAVVVISGARIVCHRKNGMGFESILDKGFPTMVFLRHCMSFLGLGPRESHHLENMAQRGEPSLLTGLQEIVQKSTDSFSFEALQSLTGFKRRIHDQEFTQQHFDFAASVQCLLNLEVIKQIECAGGRSALGKTSLSGGIFHNWSLNDAVAEALGPDQCVVSFAPGVAGCAIGGPLSCPGVTGKDALSPFLGPQYSHQEIKAVLDNCKARYRYHSSSRELIEIACRAVHRGEMVGWFSGPAEFGPKALGSRSIFMNPANRYACDNLNTYLKKRPRYMSYGVSMTVEAALPYVKSHSPFMSYSTYLPEYFGNSRVRVQTVEKREAPLFHELLEQFSSKHGIPALLNTSLNYFGEPIALEPRDALKTFFASGLDTLIIGNFVLSKNLD